MIVLLCCFKFHMIILEATRAVRDWQSKQDKYAEMRKRKLVSEIFFLLVFQSTCACTCVCVDVGFVLKTCVVLDIERRSKGS
jgi:hypothetical protein